MQPPMMPMTCRHPTVSTIECDVSFAFICDGCQEMGYGSRYQCTNGCNYTLHEECMTASEVAHHHFFERRPFTLQLKQFPKSTNLCTACGIAVTGWRYYHPLENDTYIFLHPCCMKMPHCIETDEGDRLFLKQQLTSLKCGFCERTTLEGPVKGWAYMSSDQELVGHVRCMKDKKYEEYYAKAVAPAPIQEAAYYQHQSYYYVGQPSNRNNSITTRTTMQFLQARNVQLSGNLVK